MPCLALGNRPMATEERNILDVGSRAVEVVHQLQNWSYLISSSKTTSQSFSRHHQRHIPRDITSSLNHSQHTHISFPSLSHTHTHPETGHLVITVSNRFSGAQDIMPSLLAPITLFHCHHSPLWLYTSSCPRHKVLCNRLLREPR